MKTNSPLAGFYTVLQLYTGFRLLYYLSNILPPIFSPEPINNSAPSPFLVGIVESFLLLLFVSWKKFHILFKTNHLPLAIGWATIGPLVEESMLLAGMINIIHGPDFRNPHFINEMRQQFITSQQFQLAIFLFMPLLLVSWQYSFRVVASYVFSLAVINLGLMAILFPNFTFLSSFAGSVIFRTLIFLLMGYVINRLAVEQRDKNRQLAIANQKLAACASTMEQLTLSRERNRLAREFHDTLAHTLSAAAVQLEAVVTLWKSAPEKAYDILNQSLVTVRDGLKETRRAIQALRASVLDEFTFTQAIKNLAITTEKQYGLKLNLQIPESLDDLNPEIEHNIFRIISESLHNIGQHARASSVDLFLSKDESNLTFVIRDNGIGFDLNQIDTENHLGIKGMEERAEAIGAVIKIKSRPGEGTVIQFVMASS